MTLYNLDMFMEGRIDQILEALLTSDTQERLAEAGLN
jgi:peptide chain release factor 1